MLLLYAHFFRLKELFQVKNRLLFFGFWKMPKILVGPTTLDGEKKEDGLKSQLSKISPSLIIIATSFGVILLNANNIVPLCLNPDQGD